MLRDEINITAINEYTYPPPPPCLLGHTRIRTPASYTEVKQLRSGDIVTTADGRDIAIKRIYKGKLVANEESAPYQFKANSIATGYPAATFEVSPTHAVAAPGGWIIPKYASMSGVKAKQVMVGEEITYYHIELPNYLTDNLVVEGGAVVESFGVSWLRAQPKGTAVYVFNHSTKLFDRVAGAGAKKAVAAIGGF